MSILAAHNRIARVHGRGRVILWDGTLALALSPAVCALRSRGLAAGLCRALAALLLLCRGLWALRAPGVARMGGVMPVLRFRRVGHACCKLNKAPPTLA